MKRLRAAVATLALAASGCAPTGVIYSNTTVPLDVDYDQTPFADLADTGDTRSIQYYIRVEWGDASIGEIARKYRFEKIYYADISTLSVLGVWSQQIVTIYGERPLQ